MDAKGLKLSKCLGNTTTPFDLMKDHGADILRLWALTVDFTEDHRIGNEILKGVADQYRKLRNTFRYLLGALADSRRRERRGLGDAGAGAVHAHVMAELDASCDAPSMISITTAIRACWPISPTTICRPSISTSARTSSTATWTPSRTSRPTSAARTAPCSTRSSTRWSAGCRRCWCSPPRKCGARAIRRAGRCTCWNGRRRRRHRDGRGMDGPCGAARSRSPRRSSRCAATIRRVQPRSRGHVPDLPATPDAAAEVFIVSSVKRRRRADRGRDRKPQMRPVLAPPARSPGGRRALRSLRGRAEYVGAPSALDRDRRVPLSTRSRKWIVLGPLVLRKGADRDPAVLQPDIDGKLRNCSSVPAADDATRWTLVAMTAAIVAGVACLDDARREKGRRDRARDGAWRSARQYFDRVRLGYVVDFADLHFGDFPPS